MQKFNPFDPVLVRQSANHVWSVDLYDRYDRFFDNHVVISGATVEDTNILPYNEETRHLHGTVGEFTKWVPKKGEPILVKDDEMNNWTLRIFLGMRNNKYMCTSDPSIHNTTASWDCAKPYINPFKE
jgi:hypothetical protein